MPAITTTDENAYTFLESLDLSKHPIKNAKRKIVVEYYNALSHIVNSVINQMKIPNEKIYRNISEMLKLYSDALNLATSDLNSIEDKGLDFHLAFFVKHWRKKYFYMLLCDIALVLSNKNLYFQAVDIVSEKANKGIKKIIGQTNDFLADQQAIDSKHLYLLPLLQQYYQNSSFLSQTERRIIITANMSTGKSTLINALVGKLVARTSQEVCTGNICYIYNKPFEDGRIHLQANKLCLDASPDDLSSYNWDGKISISTFCTSVSSTIPRMCLIDTPGVDAALHKEHCATTREALLHDMYDIVLYVVSPTRLGTDAEKKHLAYLNQLVRSRFVLEKAVVLDILADNVTIILAFENLYLICSIGYD